MTSLKYKNNQSVLVVIYAESTHRVLMLQRQDDPSFWQSVTGTLETNETPRETAIREVWEEVGLKIEENSTALSDEPTFNFEIRIAFTGTQEQAINLARKVKAQYGDNVSLKKMN